MNGSPYRRILLAGSAVGLGLGLPAGCASTSTSRPAAHADASTSCTPVYFSADPSLPPGSNDLIGTIDTIGQDQFRDTYVGLTQPSTGTIVIFETQPNPALIQAARQVKGGDQLTITEKIVPRSFGQLNGLANRIMDDVAAGKLDALHIVSTGQDTASDTTFVEVVVPGCDGPTRLPHAQLAKLQAVFDARYGKGLVTVSPISTVQGGF